MKRVRVGLIGCGRVAQIMHLPYIEELDDKYELSAICDLSPSLLRRIGDQYRVREDRRYTDYRQLVEADLDAVFVLTPGCHVEYAVAAAQAGKHLLVEKPLCYSLENADRIVDTAAASGITLMVGYMKRYDPGYLRALDEIKATSNIRFAHVHDLAGPNDAFTDDAFTLRTASDVPREALVRSQKEMTSAMHQALGNASPSIVRAYRLMLGLTSHDLTIMRGALGDPKRVVSTSIWDGGRHFASVLEYGENGVAVFDGGEMSLKKWDEEFTVQAETRTIRVRFPNPFLRNAPTLVDIWEMDGTHYQERTITASYEEAFRRELEHFFECIVSGREPVTSGIEARRDMELILEMVSKAEVLP